MFNPRKPTTAEAMQLGIRRSTQPLGVGWGGFWGMKALLHPEAGLDG